MKLRNPMLTGSRAYGTPREDSDIDLLEFMDDGAARQLASKAEWQGEDEYDDESGWPAFSLRFGKLNLIIKTDEREFDAWASATEDLILRAPVTRDEACRVIRRRVEAARERARWVFDVGTRVTSAARHLAQKLGRLSQDDAVVLTILRALGAGQFDDDPEEALIAMVQAKAREAESLKQAALAAHTERTQMAIEVPSKESSL